MNASTPAGFYRYQRPVYSIDFANSVYTSYKYKHNEHIFTVEQGTEFHLKFNVTANPWPTDDDVYRNGHLLQYSPQGTIYSGVDYIRIRSVNQSHSGKYKLTSTNNAGKGQISFHLKVKGM